MQFEPNRKSLQKHRPPQWFKNAKLGIFIHWGLYSVSGFATTEYGSIVDILTFKSSSVNVFEVK